MRFDAVGLAFVSWGLVVLLLVALRHAWTYLPLIMLVPAGLATVCSTGVCVLDWSWRGVPIGREQDRLRREMLGFAGIVLIASAVLVVAIYAWWGFVFI
jgi:hypothetical protein